MKRADFELLHGYRDQAPRCYLCLHNDAEYGKSLCINPVLEKAMRVKPNGICDNYTPGPKAKENKNTK